ncbi:elongation factor P hydroxylase, partial [Klebsiella pneumoniae]|uniref:elongation factor P hydroxylase n=1 Tax=Klebsiella pneumoniae TaxID=573 RepID=UPI00403D1416
SVAEQEGQQTETEATGAPQKHHYTLNQQVGSITDFGYWYCPDGRDAMTQSQFEDVEVKPQAFEWLFCVAAGFPFNVSCDNLEGDVEPDRIAFQRRVHARVMTLLEQGIPERPARFIRALQHYYQTPPLTAKHFPWPEDLH